MLAPDIKVTGTLSAVNDACQVPLNQAATIRYQIGGTFTGTWQLEGSMDGGQSWQSVFAFANAAAPGSRVSSGTTTGIWDADVAGWNAVRIRCSAISSGSIVVSAMATGSVSTSTVAASTGGGGGGGGTVDQGAAAALAGAWPVKVTDGSTAVTIKGASTAPVAADPALVIAISPNTPVGGGTQYTAGAAQASPTGTVALGSDGTNVRALSTDVSGKLNVVQGPAGTPPQGWFTKITDGSTVATVKPASTAAVATDLALVVAVSPNNTLGVTAASLPLPSGAATAANQATGNASLSSIDTKLTNPLPVSLSAAPLATGAATSALQTTGNTSVDNIDTKTPALVGGKVPVDVGTPSVSVSNFPATQPVSAASLPLPTGAATETTLATLSGKMPSQGQAAMAASQPVVIASNQTAVPVSGTVTANIGTSGSLALDATLTGGTAKTITRTATKGATIAADVTSTAASADRQPLDVTLYDTSGSAITSFGGGIPSDVVTTGTFTANGQTLVTPDLNGFGSVSCYMSASGPIVIAFEGTVDGTTWFALWGSSADHQTSTYVPASSMNASNASVQLWRVNTTGVKTFRLRVTSFSSSTSVIIRASAYGSNVLLSEPVVLSAGSAAIGSVSVSGTVSTNTADSATTGSTLNAVAATALNATAGRFGTSIKLIPASYVATLVPEFSVDAGSTYQTGYWYDPAVGTWTQSLAFAGTSVAVYRTFICPPGTTHVRARCTSFTSGSCTGSVYSTLAGEHLPRSFQTSAISSVAVSTTVATLKVANSLRRQLIIWNESGQELFVKFGTAAAATAGNYTLRIANAAKEIISDWQGDVTAILSTGSGNVSVTESS